MRTKLWYNRTTTRNRMWYFKLQVMDGAPSMLAKTADIILLESQSIK